jgi:thiol:disulfide interchange protein
VTDIPALTQTVGYTNERGIPPEVLYATLRAHEQDRRIIGDAFPCWCATCQQARRQLFVTRKAEAALEQPTELEAK